MAPIALLLCLIFSAWFIARDVKRRRSVSAAVWLPTILLLVLGSRPVSVWLNANVQYGGMGNDAPRSPFDEGFYMLILAGSWLIATLRHVKWGKVFAANAAIMAIYIFFAASVLWSADPLGSTKRLFKDFGLLFVISVIFSEKDPLEALQAVYCRCAAVLFPLSVVFIRYYPALGRGYSVGGEPMATGVAMQKNSLGEIVLVFGLFLIWDCLDPRPARAKDSGARIPWASLLLLAMGAWLLDMSQSKTALTCVIVGSVLIFVSGRFFSKTMNRVVLVSALSLPFLVLLTQQFNSIIGPLLEALGRDATFTGRTNIWQHISVNTVDPLVGAGYWNFWGGKGGLAIGQAMHTPVPNAHNGYLDLYLDGGWIGLILLYLMLFVCGNRIIRGLRGSRSQSVMFAIVVASIIYNLSESNFLRLSPLWFTTLLALVYFPQLKNATAGRDVGATTTAHPVVAVRLQENDRYQGVRRSSRLSHELP
jgi:exopolysaccharide production protein ExoQ